MLYEFNTIDAEIEENKDKENKKKEENMSVWIIIIIIIVILIIAFFLFFIIWRKIRIKSGNLENEVNDIGINENLNDNQELKENKRDSGSYLNTFI